MISKTNCRLLDNEKTDSEAQIIIHVTPLKLTR